MLPSGPLFWIFALLNLVAFFWMVIVGFRRHWGWGLAVLLVPFALLVFAIMYWEDAKKPFLLYLVTTIVLVYQIVSVAANQGAALLQDPKQSTDTASSVFGDRSQIDQARAAAAMAMQQIEAMHRAGLIGDEELAQLRAEHDANMAALGYDSEDTPDLDFAEPVDEGDVAGEVAEVSRAQPTESLPPADQEEQPDTVAKISPPAPTAPKAKPKPRRTGKIDVSEAHRFIGRQFIVTDKNQRTRLATLSAVSDGKLEFQRRMRTGALTFSVYKNDITNLVLK